MVSGEFVGAIPNAGPRDPPGGPADELVAVAVYDPSPTGARRIRIYICDSEQLSPAGDAEWFTGTITGDAFNLPSADGDARIQGQLTETAVTGTATLPDGRVLNFRAVPAQAGAGLYEFFFLVDRSYSGLSAGGAEFKGTVIRQTTVRGIVHRVIRGTVKTLTGVTTPPFNVLTRISGKEVPPGSLPSSVIILPNATGVAGRSNQIRSKEGPTTEFYCWIEF